MLKDIIEELESIKEEDPVELLHKFIEVRLDQALKSYYADLVTKFSYYSNLDDKKSMSTIKKLLKD